MVAAIQVGQRGTLTLPAEVRERHQIQPGDAFRLLDIEGILVLVPMTPMVPALAREIELARVEAGLSVEEMLTSLREQRELYYTEKFGREREDASAQ